MYLEAVIPGADGAPGEVVLNAGLLIEEGSLSDASNAFPDAVARRIVDCTEHPDPEFKRGSGVLHCVLHGVDGFALIVAASLSVMVQPLIR